MHQTGCVHTETPFFSFSYTASLGKDDCRTKVYSYQHSNKRQNHKNNWKKDHIVERASALNGFSEGGGKPPDSHCQHHFSLRFFSVFPLPLHLRKRHEQSKEREIASLCVTSFGYGLFWVRNWVVAENRTIFLVVVAPNMVFSSPCLHGFIIHCALRTTNG